MRYNYIIHGLRRGHVVSLPTDTVYGLSCIIHPDSMRELFALKKRDTKKGFIVLTSNLEYLEPYLDDEVLGMLEYKYATITTPTPTTFVVPCTHHIATNSTLAIRLTDDPYIAYICSKLQQAIISTSANISGKTVIRNMWSLKKYFAQSLRYYIRPKSTLKNPSRIIDLLTGERYR